MATKNVILKDSSSNELRPETVLTQVKDASGNDLFTQTSGVISTTTGNSINGASINDASIGAAKLANGVFEGLKDSQGNLRFIQGNITVPSALNPIYNKWTLSGSHLMIVSLFKISPNQTIASYELGHVLSNIPTWVYNKIYSFNGSTTGNVATQKVQGAHANGFVETNDQILVYLDKQSGGTIIISNVGSYTNSGSEDIYFRIQFDLIIE